MSTDVAVRRFLESKGCDPNRVERGIEGLLEDWEDIATQIGQGVYQLGLDDYLNDMDAREILEGAVMMPETPPEADVLERLEAADEQVRAATIEASRCLWGDALARDHGWQPETHWWYYRFPREHNEEFAKDLQATGVEG